MCGIAGIYNFEGKPVERERLERMAEVMRYRGPDGSGMHVDGSFGMSMRRLSIIDLDTGDQPMFNEDGTVAVIFNGEVYNYRELRAGLESRGHKFRTKSDTEVIVHLYEERGADLADALCGMFAIAVWDASRRRLLLVRDRLGVKPLYYAEHAGELLFGSEIKALFAAADVPRKVDAAGLDAYMQVQYFPLERTAFAAVKKLRAGHRMIVEDGRCEIEKWWEVRFPQTHERVDEASAVSRFRELFFKSVERRLVSDVPVGAFLSGGIDSSAVVAAMAEAAGGDVKTFTIGFGAEAREFSELEHAQQAAEAFGAERFERVIRAEEVGERIERVLAHFDEPFGGGLHTFLVSEIAAPHVKVALSGIGADELLGGYERQKKARLVARYAGLPDGARRAALAGARALRRSRASLPLADKIEKLDRLSRASALDLYFEWIAVFDDSFRRMVYKPDFYNAVSEKTLGASLAPLLGNAMPKNLDDRISFLELKTTLADDFLNYTDRMSMAWSLEARTPFLDHELVEYCATLPIEMKVRNGETKYILKKAMECALPEEITGRAKQPFVLPIGIWFRGPLRPLVEKTLMRGELAAESYIEPAAAAALAREHLDGAADHSWRLWSLIMLERWFRKYAPRT